MGVSSASNEGKTEALLLLPLWYLWVMSLTKEHFLAKRIIQQDPRSLSKKNLPVGYRVTRHGNLPWLPRQLTQILSWVSEKGEPGISPQQTEHFIKPLSFMQI